MYLCVVGEIIWDMGLIYCCFGGYWVIVLVIFEFIAIEAVDFDKMIQICAILGSGVFTIGFFASGVFTLELLRFRCLHTRNF